jgi:hypothetical protein
MIYAVAYTINVLQTCVTTAVNIFIVEAPVA